MIWLEPSGTSSSVVTMTSLTSEKKYKGNLQTQGHPKIPDKKGGYPKNI